MTDEVNGASSAAETTVTQEQPVKVDLQRIERQAKYAAADPDGFDAFTRGYEAAGGTRLKEMRETFDKTTGELRDEIAVIRRERAIEKALRVFNLEDSDADLIQGTTEDEVMENAEKLAKRIGAGKSKDDDERPARGREDDARETVVTREKLTPKEEFIRGFGKAEREAAGLTTWPPRSVR